MSVESLFKKDLYNIDPSHYFLHLIEMLTEMTYSFKQPGKEQKI